jgi:heme-degrading monooxygenase HmoA
MMAPILASSTGASAIRGGAMRAAGATRRVVVVKPQQQQRKQQPARPPAARAPGGARPTRTRAASPDHHAAPLAASKPRASVVAARAAAAAEAPAAAVAPAKPAAKDPATTPFTNTQRFVVSPSSAASFQTAWREREAAMRQSPGFQGLSVISDGLTGDTVVSASWASIVDFERWMTLDACRRSHLPPGVWQYVPRKGEGFPEDFVPFVSYDEPVNAKYF